MLPGISLFVLALAVSLDGLGVGMMYGIRKIKIPLLSVAIISLWSGLVILASMQIGTWLAEWISPALARKLGAVILIGIGIWALYQLYMQKHPGREEPGRVPENQFESLGVPVNGKLLSREVVSIELKRFGLVIQILRTPSVADVDRSGNISAYEATLLGLALSLDAFGAGIGAALIGFSPIVTSAVIASSGGFFIAMGLKAGYRFADLNWVKRLSVLPGCVLVLMGLIKLFG
ncbi:sporulation membrane protein YtaF [Paenibacillus larvae]